MGKLNIQKIVAREFTSQDIDDACGLKPNVIHVYHQAGALIPDIDQGKGTGHRRLFSATNFMEAAIISYMMGDGMPRRVIVDTLKSIRSANERHLLNPASIIKSMFGHYLVLYNEGGKFRHQFLTEDSSKTVMSSLLLRVPEFTHVFNLTSLFNRYFSVIE